MLAQLLAPPPGHGRAVAAAVQCTQHAGEHQCRLAQLAGAARGRVAACLGIEQHGRHGGGQVATRAGAEGAAGSAV
jgi:hypothetical protein